MKRPSWKIDGLNYLHKLLSLSNLKRRWLVEETTVKGEEPNKIETIKFLDKWIRRLEEMREEIIKMRS